MPECREPLAAYVRRSGAVGKPRVTSASAPTSMAGSAAAGQRLDAVHRQAVNTYGPRPQRMFIMDASRSGLPVTVLHLFGDSTATMRGKLLSLATVVDAADPRWTAGRPSRSSTISWYWPLERSRRPRAVESRRRSSHVRGDYTGGDQTVSAELTFNAGARSGRLRLRGSAARFDGRQDLHPQGWSTPLSEHREADGRRVLAVGEGRWHAPPPEGQFTYIEFHLDAITYNVRQCSMSSRLAAVTRRTAVHRDGDGVSHTRILRNSWMLLFISLSYVIVTAGWIASENRSLLPIMELLTIWSAVAVLLLMVEIHRGAADAHRSGSLTALLLTAAMAAVTMSNHFLYLTVLPQLYPGTTMPAVVAPRRLALDHEGTGVCRLGASARARHGLRSHPRPADWVDQSNGPSESAVDSPSSG